MNHYDFSKVINREKSWKWDHEGIINGQQVLPMSVSDMDFISPYEVTQALREIVDNGVFGYCSFPRGHEEAIADWQKSWHNWNIDPRNIVLTNGLLTSMFLMLKAISNPGEGVIIFTPVYQNFADGIRGANRLAVPCELICNKHNYWNIDFDHYESLCKKASTRAAILCNPHNPVGRLWTKEELNKLISIAQDNDVIVFSDEIHSDFFFETPFNPALVATEDKRNIIVFSSGGKIFNIGGLYSSYAVTEDLHLRKRLDSVLENDAGHPNTFSIWASYTGYKNGYQYRKEVVDYIRKMQTKMVNAINQLPFSISASLPRSNLSFMGRFSQNRMESKNNR